MWKHGQDPLILPPGIDSSHYDAPPANVQASITALAGSRPLLFAPSLPPSRGSAVYGALVTLRSAGLHPLLVLGSPPDEQVLTMMSQHTYTVDAQGEVQIAREAAAGDVLVPSEPLNMVTERAFYASAFATLLVDYGDATATSLLQAMAAGAVVIADDAMHDPLIPFANGVALETKHPAEIVATLIELHANPQRLQSMRATARRTAAGYTWPHTLASVLVTLAFLAGERVR